MKKKSYILVYDSGIGGLTTLANIYKMLPNYNYIYFADNKNCPYGNKCKSELQEIVSKNISNLLKRYNITHIVLACNTATTATIELLRHNYKIPIIGTEPNVKSPYMLGYKDITVIATPATVKQEKFLNLEHSLSFSPTNIGIKNLAICIENYYLHNSVNDILRAKKIINSALLRTNKSSAIVLGCTHYIFMKKYIENLGYACFDGNIGVAKRLKSLLNDTTKLSISPSKANNINIITDSVINNLKYKKILLSYINSIKTTTL